MKINDALLKNLYEEAEEEGKISREILLENSGREWDVPHAFCNPISNHNSDFCFTVSDLNHQLLLFPKDNLIPVPVPDRTKPYPIFLPKRLSIITSFWAAHIYTALVRNYLPGYRAALHFRKSRIKRRRHLFKVAMWRLTLSPKPDQHQFSPNNINT